MGSRCGGETVLEDRSHFLRVLEEVVPLDHLVLVGGQEDTRCITHPRVEMAHRRLHLRIFAVVEAAGLHLLGKGHEIWWRFKAPLLMSPVGASSHYTRLDFVNDEVDALFFG